MDEKSERNIEELGSDEDSKDSSDEDSDKKEDKE